MGWLLHVFGIDDVSGRWYAWWSGVGGDLTILAAPLVLFRKHNCHYRWCWRIGHFPQEGFVVCRRHFKGVSDESVG